MRVGASVDCNRLDPYLHGIKVVVAMVDMMTSGGRSKSSAIQMPLSPALHFGRMLGASVAMRRLYPLCERLAMSNVPLIVEGETGTGKEVLAESLHDQGPRAREPFTVFDCTAVPPNLVEAALFGHERGAFTGATELRQGVFEQAHGGTLLISSCRPSSCAPSSARRSGASAASNGSGWMYGSSPPPVAISTKKSPPVVSGTISFTAWRSLGSSFPLSETGWAISGYSRDTFGTASPVPSSPSRTIFSRSSRATPGLGTCASSKIPSRAASSWGISWAVKRCLHRLRAPFARRHRSMEVRLRRGPCAPRIPATSSPTSLLVACPFRAPVSAFSRPSSEDTSNTWSTNTAATWRVQQRHRVLRFAIFRSSGRERSAAKKAPERQSVSFVHALGSDCTRASFRTSPSGSCRPPRERAHARR